MNPSWLRPLAGVLLLLAAPGAALAQRTLRWENVAVAAHLDRNGELHGRGADDGVHGRLEWRAHLDRPAGAVSFESLSRFRDGAFQPMVADPKLDDVDDYAVEGTRLRWRSRRASDPAFAGSSFRYQMKYAIGHPGQGRRPLPARS